MGSGIAQVCALAGMDVLLHDVSLERIDKGLSMVGSGLTRQVASAKITEDVRAAALTHVRAATTVADLAPCDLVIEAATEDEAVKKKIFAAVCPALRPDAILATNTSSISITRLAVHDGPAGAVHRHSFHEPCAGDETGRSGARHRHQ